MTSHKKELDEMVHVTEKENANHEEWHSSSRRRFNGKAKNSLGIGIVVEEKCVRAYFYKIIGSRINLNGKK